MQPFKAPRKSKEPSSPTVQDSPTRQSPRLQGKSDKALHVIPFKKGIKQLSYREAIEMAEHGEVLRYSTDSGSEGGVDLNDVVDSEGETQLVCSRWVVKETQEADIVESDNDSEAKTDRDELKGNGERWNFEARIDRSPVAHSSEEPFTTTAASPNLPEFEAFLDKAAAPQREPPIEELRRAARERAKELLVSKNDAYWEGVLQSEKEKLQKIQEQGLTSVDAMMVGCSSDEDNGDTPVRRAANKRAKEILRAINNPVEGCTGTFASRLCHIQNNNLTHAFPL